MRRFAGLTLAVLGLSLLATTALATYPVESYRDEFADVPVAYDGSVGSLDWTSSWEEVNDDGNINTGAVHVDGEGDCVGPNCLHLYGAGIELPGVGAKRTVDTSVFSSFDICYEVRYVPYGSGNEAVLNVEKQVDGGGTWYLLASYDLFDEGFQDHPALGPIGPYDSTVIRFTVTGFLNGEVFVDDVELKGELAPEPTTTTTTTTSSTTTTTRPTTATTTTPTTTTTRATTTTAPPTTTTTTERTDSVVIVGSVDPPQGPTGPPDGSGIRDTPMGLQVAFDNGLFGTVGAAGGTYFVSADHNADFRIIAETIRASWIWMVLLGILIAWATVSGLDQNLKRSVRRKLARTDPASEPS